MVRTVAIIGSRCGRGPTVIPSGTLTAMPGAVGPSPDRFAVVVTETTVLDSACGLNSHETTTLNQLVSEIRQRTDDGWELMTAHRSVVAPHETLHDANGRPIRGRVVRHELTYRKSPPRRSWEYKIDALSDPDEPHAEQVIAERTAEGWQLVGCSRFAFEAVTPGVDHEELTHRTEDAVLFWKRSAKRSRRGRTDPAPDRAT